MNVAARPADHAVATDEEVPDRLTSEPEFGLVFGSHLEAARGEKHGSGLAGTVPNAQLLQHRFRLTFGFLAKPLVPRHRHQAIRAVYGSVRCGGHRESGRAMAEVHSRARRTGDDDREQADAEGT